MENHISNLSDELLEKEILKLENDMRFLRARLDAACSILEDRQSRAYIAAHKITPDQVEMSRGKGRPWWGTFKAFLLWLNDQNSSGTWVEWNDRIYSRAVKDGELSIGDTPALVKHLPVEKQNGKADNH